MLTTIQPPPDGTTLTVPSCSWPATMALGATLGTWRVAAARGAFPPAASGWQPWTPLPFRWQICSGLYAFKAFIAHVTFLELREVL